MSTPALTPDLRFDPETHTYWHGLEQYQSVSRLLKQLWPIKKSFDGVNPAVIENARDRGVRIDGYCCTYAKTGEVDIPSGEREDVIQGVESFVNWWVPCRCETQKILADSMNGIAGTADIVMPEIIYDIKCTWQPEADWPYQLGAYAYMWSLEHPDEAPPGLAAIHINRKKYREGLKVVEYNTSECISKWTNLLNFYRDVRPLLDQQKESQ